MSRYTIVFDRRSGTLEDLSKLGAVPHAASDHRHSVPARHNAKAKRLESYIPE
jgi:hypothetical protein